MSDTIRQQILNNLMTRFEGMNSASGYNTDYIHVDEWRRYPYESDDYPSVVIEDSVNTVKHFDDYLTDYELQLNVGIIISGTEPATQIRSYISDVYKCIGNDVYCGGLSVGIEPVSDNIILQLKDLNYGMVDTQWIIKYSVRSFDLTKQA